MTLIGVRAENHPQQVGKRAAKDAVDDRETLPEVFAERWWRCLVGRHIWEPKHDGRCVELCCAWCGRWRPWHKPIRRWERKRGLSS